MLCLWRPCSTHFKLAVIVNQQNCAKVVRLVSEQKSAGLVRVKCLSPPTTVSGICRMVPPSVPPTLVPVYADLTSPIGQPPLGVGGTSGMWKLCILGRELLVNDHLPLVIPHFTAKRIALWVGGGGWSHTYGRSQRRQLLFNSDQKIF